MLNLEKLRDAYSYDPVRGIIFHSLPFRHLPAGRKVYFSKMRNGYLYIKIGPKRYLLHRVIWYIVTGEWPPMIDHKDRDKTNNKWDNLRTASISQNMRNVIYKPGATGVRGVSTHGKKFKARIANNGKSEYIGTFKTVQEAHEAYMVRARELGAEFSAY